MFAVIIILVNLSSRTKLMTRLFCVASVIAGADGGCIGQDAVGRRGLIHYRSKGEPGDGSRRVLDGGGIWGHKINVYRCVEL